VNVYLHALKEWLLGTAETLYFVSRVSHLNMCCLVRDKTTFFAKKYIEIMHLVVVTPVSLSKFFTGFYQI